MSTEAISLPDDLSISHEIILQQHEQLVSSQRRIEQLNRLYSVLTQADQAIVRVRENHALWTSRSPASTSTIQLPRPCFRSSRWTIA